MERPSDPPKPATLVLAAALFYGLMSVMAVIALSLMDLDPALVVFGPDDAELSEGHPPLPLGHVPAALLGTAAGLAVVGLSWLMRRLGPLDRLQREFGAVLGEQSTATIAVLAVTSAIGEELLFRGALTVLIGVWPTAVLFGILHGGATPRLFAWTIFAFLSGLLLAWLADLTAALLAPMLCHLTINFWNLQALGHQRDAAPP